MQRFDSFDAMSVFAEYASYYNLLYQNKDYDGEVEFVSQMLQKYAPGTQALLELGCGTGRHAQSFAQRGYTVAGIDISADMLLLAQQRIAQLPSSVASKLSFSFGDLRNIRLNRQFDAVISLFHVYSYQTTNADLLSAFETAKTHLKPDGVLLFDFWYGPAVLNEKPSVRIKRLESEEIAVVRIAEPELKANDNMVEVRYTVFITDKATGAVKQIWETHRMRYLFLPEIELLLSQVGLQLVTAGEWMTPKPASANSWGVYVVARQADVMAQR